MTTNLGLNPLLESAPISAAEAVGHIIANSGNLKLAAVTASADASKGQNKNLISEAMLLTIVASDPNSIVYMAAQLRMLLIAQTLDVLRQTRLAFMEKLPSLSAKDTASTYTAILKSLSILTQGAPLELPDPMEAVLQTLPAEVRDALAVMQQTQEQPE